MSAQHTIVLHLGDDRRTVDGHHLHVDGTIVKKNMAALMHIRSEVRVREVDHIVGLGDPMELNVRGYELSVRNADAALIEVE